MSTMIGHQHSGSETARPLSQAGRTPGAVHHRQISQISTTDTFQPSRSETLTSSKSRQRRKSRGSTASIQSSGTSVQYQQDHPHAHSVFMPSQHQQQLYQASPEEMLSGYDRDQFAHTQPYRVDQNVPAQPQAEMAAEDLQQYGIHHQAFHQEVPPYGAPQDHIHHALTRTPTFDPLDNQSPAPEDSETAENGQRRKKGSATSLANDAELRRLLHQYQGRTLQDVAEEVQQNEGGGGKSEKAKQVFAMLWLQESCERSTHSVRRDRVFQRYTQRCGDERVPTLNPASFGKLVRIIFPNVQTRRLGVRGESKYHYVDLSLTALDGKGVSTYQPPQALSRSESQHNRDDSLGDASVQDQLHVPHGNTHQPQMSAAAAPPDTAEFPPPRASFAPQSADLGVRYNVSPPSSRKREKMHCEKSNTPLVRIPTTKMSQSLIDSLPSVRSSLPATLTTYLGLPSSTSHTSPSTVQTEAKIELPDIHSYLVGAHYDPPIADSLSSLYRSYCIMVIDSFRFCREKPFFHHHAAFNGTMTVPVAKLLAEPCVAPWIHECDMRMYKKMIRYIAPLVTQVVPDPVWAMFDRVSTKLVGHLVGAFEEKCPTHAVAAKVVPATRFCQLLKKLARVNQAANNVAPLLSDESARSQMWADMVTLVSPERLLGESMPSPECWNAVERNLRDEMRPLLSPLDENALRQIEGEGSTEWSQYFADAAGPRDHNHSEPRNESNLDRWIQWLERLPKAFDGHHPQCIIDWHTRFWDSMMTQFGMGGAQSYQAWWFLKAFLSSMLGWLTQMEGLLLPETEQRRAEVIEQEKRIEDDGWSNGAGHGAGLKRKRTDDDVGGEERAPAFLSPNFEEIFDRSRQHTARPQHPHTRTATLAEDHEERRHEHMNETVKGENEDDGNANENENEILEGENRQSDDPNHHHHHHHHQPQQQPQKSHQPPYHYHPHHDDSGISLDADVEEAADLTIPEISTAPPPPPSKSSSPNANTNLRKQPNTTITTTTTTKTTTTTTETATAAA